MLAQLNKRMLLKNVTVRYLAMQYAHLNPEPGVMRIAHGPFHLRPEDATISRYAGFRQDSFQIPNTK